MPARQGYARARGGGTRGARRANACRTSYIGMDCARTERDQAAIRVSVPRGSETDRAWSVVPANGVPEGFFGVSRAMLPKLDRGRGVGVRSKGGTHHDSIGSIGFRGGLLKVKKRFAANEAIWLRERENSSRAPRSNANATRVNVM